MPQTPPPVVPVERFDPRYLTEEDLDDASSFTGLSREACLQRIHNYSITELATAWREADPRTPEEMMYFYASTQLYVWEQLQWHASPDRGRYWRALEQVVDRFPADAGYRRVLDFGAGIGTDALYLASHGYDVTLVDVDCPAFAFARHRFKRRRLPGRFIRSTSPLPRPDRTYDVVVSFDVFEHLPDPLEAARRLVTSLRAGGLLLQTGSFVDDGHQPCHLREGVHRFGGARWGIYLAGLGLRGIGPTLLMKARGGQAFAQRARFAVWRATGLWLSRIPPA